MTSNRGFGIPASKDRDPAIERIRELMEIGTGQRRNQPGRKWVTFDDLTKNRFARLGKDGTLQPDDGLLTPPPKYVGPLYNLQANGAFKNIVLSWEGTDQVGYAYTEIWRHDADNLANATLVATSRAPVVAHYVPDSRVWYFWVRAVSTTGHKGPFNASAGVSAQTAEDVQWLLDTLTDSITESQLAQDLTTQLDQIDTNQQAIVEQSLDIDGLHAQYTVKIDANGAVAGFGLASTPDDDTTDGSFSEFYINADRFAILPQGDTPGDTTTVAPFIVQGGVVYMANAMIKDGSIQNAKIGSLAADKIFAATGTIASVLIGTADITNAMVQSLNANKLYASTGTIAEAIIGTGHINNAMIGNEIKSDNFSDFFETGWQILKSGDATFYGVVISRPNRVAYGTWQDPRYGTPINTTQSSTYDWFNNDNNWDPPIGPEYIDVEIDTGYDNQEDINQIDSGGLIVRAKVSHATVYTSASWPSGTKWYECPVEITQITSVNHSAAGTINAPGGRIIVKVRMYPPKDIYSQSQLEAIRYDEIKWSLLKIT